MARIFDKLTYANVVATLALFVALGGVSYAALQLPKNSVGTKQLKKKAVTSQKIAKGAVTEAKLGANARAALRGARGPRGDAGPKGDTGAPGPSEALTAPTPDESLVDGVVPTQLASLALPAGQWILFAHMSPEGTTGEPIAVCFPKIDGANGRTSRNQLAVGKQEGLTLIEPITLAAPTTVAVLCDVHSGTFTVYGEETTVVALRIGALH